MSLTDTQIERYSRQIILPEVGGVGQEKLLASRVALIGENEVVEWAALYLAAAGVGALGGSARPHPQMLSRLNPDCGVSSRSGNAVDLTLVAGEVDLVAAERRMVIAPARGSRGSVTVFDPASAMSACLACASQPPPTGPPDPSAHAVVALIAVTEVVKLILGVGKPLLGRRLTYDAAAQLMREEPLGCVHSGGGT